MPTAETTSDKSDTIIPVDIDKIPIIYDSNPARISGVLSELMEFYQICYRA